MPSPRSFTKADIDFVVKLVVAILPRYPEQTKGYNLVVVAEPGDTRIEIGFNYIIESELESVPSVLPRKDWRKQQVYRVTAMWEEFSYSDGSDLGEADLGTARSLSDAIQIIMLDIVRRDLAAICEGVDYPETPITEEV